MNTVIIIHGSPCITYNKSQYNCNSRYLICMKYIVSLIFIFITALCPSDSRVNSYAQHEICSYAQHLGK